MKRLSDLADTTLRDTANVALRDLADTTLRDRQLMISKFQRASDGLSSTASDTRSNQHQTDQ